MTVYTMGSQRVEHEWVAFLFTFMDLTFQVPMQYCSLQLWTILPSPVTFTSGHCICFGSASSFFLELFLHSPPEAYWSPTNPESLSFSVLFIGFSRQEYWSGLPFPSPVDNVLVELSAMAGRSWMALQSMTHSFIKLDKAVTQVINLLSSVILVSFLSYSRNKDRMFVEASLWEGLAVGESGSCSDWRGHAQ